MVGTPSTGEREPTLSWEVEVPLLNNPRLLRAVALIAALAGSLPLLLIAPLLAIQGEWQVLMGIVRLFLVLAVALVLLMLLAMAVVFRNRLRLRFTIDAEGIVQDTIDSRTRLVNRLAMVGGLLLASPATSGAGLLAIGREREQLLWSGAFRLERQPFPRRWRRGPFVFSNRWRPLLEVYATEANRQEVYALIRHYLAAHQPERRLNRSGGLAGTLLQSLLVLLACALVGVAGRTFGLDPLPLILLLAFAQAMVWMLPPFAWVVLALEGVILALSLAAVATGRGFTGDAILALVLQGLGLLYLGWLCRRVLQGRWLPVLLHDERDMGGP